MADALLRFVIRTPHEIVVDAPVRSARVLTETGHVGLRVQMEPVALAVEPGLVLLTIDEGARFAGSAGGLLLCDGSRATLFTPLGVAGGDAAAVQRDLDRALAAPGAEQQVRRTLDRLEGRILLELRRQPAVRPEAGERG